MEAMNTRAREDVGVEDDSTQTELTKIRLLRTMVETQDPSSKVNFLISLFFVSMPSLLY